MRASCGYVVHWHSFLRPPPLFLPPLRPDQFFPMPILGFPPSMQFAARESRAPAPGADWAGAPSLSRLCPMAAEVPILTSDLDRARIHGPAPGTARNLSAKGAAQARRGAIALWAHDATQSKESWRRPYPGTTLTAGEEGARLLQTFCCSGPADRPACYPDNRAPAPNAFEEAQARGNVQF